MTIHNYISRLKLIENILIVYKNVLKSQWATASDVIQEMYSQWATDLKEEGRRGRGNAMITTQANFMIPFLVPSY